MFLSCESCKSFQPVHTSVDYFHIFGLEKVFEIEETNLEKTYKEWQKKLIHPDLVHTKSEELDEEPNPNYYKIKFLILEYLNAAWELARSLTMGYTHGPEYKEGWFCILLRLMGLALPGISAHCPTDYVKSVRLGRMSSSSYSSPSRYPSRRSKFVSAIILNEELNLQCPYFRSGTWLSSFTGSSSR
ncbi:uncharacterized protein LOC113343690 isoform X2 [Papaver somniferum]|uniref:uncharacterized protein LOC113343690 isoform X2 n=1 Tax=Papaver somniferum TaxID=3469 RepID=UPI000E70274F|nr:uncharacterized protein LOC113343690 isoform X2 [Papaver somniferum]